jgi:LuxR family transcriptional regulator, maltose regulon positive regulatory protein
LNPFLRRGRAGGTPAPSHGLRKVLLASRLTTTEIAGALYVSASTLKSHMKSIYRKPDVSSRADAVRQGHALGLI